MVGRGRRRARADGLWGGVPQACAQLPIVTERQHRIWGSDTSFLHPTHTRIEDRGGCRPEVGREVAPRDFGAREAAASPALEQGVVDGGTPRLVRQRSRPPSRAAPRYPRRLDEFRQPSDVRGEHDVRGEAPTPPRQSRAATVTLGTAALSARTPVDGHRSSTSVSTTDAPRSAAARPGSAAAPHPSSTTLLPRNSSGRVAA